MSKTTVTHLMKMKSDKKKITVLTAYDHAFASLVDAAGVDIILVGDSLGNVVQGESSTLPVTMDQMIYHTQMVSKAAKNAMVIGDMPFMSYQLSESQAMHNAGRFLKEAGATAVKLEGGVSVVSLIQSMTRIGIPVQAHIGLTPQSVHQMGGYRVQRDEERLLEDALAVEDAGAFSVVLEGIPSEIAKKITNTLKIPTIGIGAGIHCDGQVLVLHDMLGLVHRDLPKFVKQYEKLHQRILDAVQNYCDDVRNEIFPGNKHCYT
ncbi:MAG: 3-methyl-2-oxobutanoate hydroxymethyltransferase [Candidatus Magnetoglobus multicellularis str. Araruama]|uniref:3-methyl-2-oxobutanoate hydroxymethyltransferase n=1 Tax=Candidatus Magnetoglobus multicellularis str. Araruama TaxID=890399 RepID=A0A1V1PCA9_9BACT|nr:MAG: 3-methyl-2-oxobutanoate hydroxymethyltransferase [Candidatus Magnetoglobus multicellularis str. Araruama]